MRKYVLSGKAVQRALQPMPLQALYLIEAGTTDGGTEDLMPITSISSEKAAAQHLRTQTFLPRFVRGMGQEGRNFLATAQLQRTAPLARLPLPRGIERLQDWLQEQDLLQAAATARGRPEIVRKP